MGDPTERPAPLSDADLELQLDAIGRLAEVNGRQSVTVDGRRYEQVLDELLGLRAALGIRRQALPQASVDCPRCSECQGEEHHWIEDVDVRRVGYTCKHCPAWCYAVDDDDGLLVPSGKPVVITPELRAACDEVLALVEKHANALQLEAARWLLEQVHLDADLKLDAIEDGEIDDDPDLDYEPCDDAESVS